MNKLTSHYLCSVKILAILHNILAELNFKISLLTGQLHYNVIYEL